MGLVEEAATGSCKKIFKLILLDMNNALNSLPRSCVVSAMVHATGFANELYHVVTGGG